MVGHADGAGNAVEVDVKVICPLCGKHTIIITTNVRVTGDSFKVRRRRECMLCKGRFSTNEEVIKGSEAVRVDPVQETGREDRVHPGNECNKVLYEGLDGKKFTLF